jgi:hypothetical protein
MQLSAVGCSMVSKCANPGCEESFRYLHQGKLFRFERKLMVELVRTVNDPQPQVEFFWLCEKCAATMKVVYRPGVGVVTVSTAKSLPAAS